MLLSMPLWAAPGPIPDAFILGNLNGVSDGEEGQGEEKEGEVGEPEAKRHEKKKWKDMKKGTKGKRRIARAVEDHSRNMDRKRIYE